MRNHGPAVLPLDASAIHAREATRSEVVRVFWVLRAFILRAAQLTGHGDALFFLSVDEVLDVLRGDEAPLAWVPVRRATHEHYSSLPPYPTWIRGHFDPARWAADPRRRSDVYDAHSDQLPASETIRGFPGAAVVACRDRRPRAGNSDCSRLRHRHGLAPDR